MTHRPIHFPHSTRTWNGRNLAVMLAVLLGVVLALAVSGRAQAATSADDFGQHVVTCAQEHGFAGDHNPGMHQGRSGWDPAHVC
jgi:hypothetical protein